MSFILLYGKPGVGKTTMAASMTKLNKQVHFIDVDLKLDRQVNLQPLIQSGLITFDPIRHPLTEATLTQRAKFIGVPAREVANKDQSLLKQPKGFFAVTDLIDKYAESIESISRHQDASGLVLCLDSITSVVEHFDRLVFHLAKRRKFTFDEWGELLLNLEEMFSKLQTMTPTPFEHVIVTAHEMQEKEKVEGSEEMKLGDIKPLIKGQFRDKIMKFFEEAYYLQVKQVGTERIYECRTAPYGPISARTSRELPSVVPSDFSVLFSGKPIETKTAKQRREERKQNEKI